MGEVRGEGETEVCLKKWLLYKKRFVSSWVYIIGGWVWLCHHHTPDCLFSQSAGDGDGGVGRPRPQEVGH